MTEEKASETKIKPEDRVKRKGGDGCCGTVKDVRTEVTKTALDKDDSALFVYVHWDNGTMSYFTPDSLEIL